ncbi:UNVERIFIED_CONTAM: hypothetical protein RMT77_015165 [Armadillidium vulgare]
MDFKHETEIKDEILEFTEDDGKITHCLDQVLRNDELQERNSLANINIKGEIEVKDEPFDIFEVKEEFLGIEEDSMIDELVESSSTVDENLVCIRSLSLIGVFKSFHINPSLFSPYCFLLLSLPAIFNQSWIFSIYIHDVICSFVSDLDV